LAVVRSGEVFAGEICRMPASVTSFSVLRLTLDDAAPTMASTPLAM